MLLAEYLRSVGVYTPFATGGVSLPNIAYFWFGEHYEIRLAIGVTYNIPDLETMLDILRSEYITYGGIPRVDLIKRLRNSDASGLFINQANRVRLSSYPKEVDQVIDQVRQAVTMYNLTQSWDNFHWLGIYNLSGESHEGA